MKGAYRDPVDHSRTTQPHAGESFIDTLWLPGLILIMIGTVMIAACVASTAYGRTDLSMGVGPHRRSAGDRGRNPDRARTPPREARRAAVVGRPPRRFASPAGGVAALSLAAAGPVGVLTCVLQCPPLSDFACGALRSRSEVGNSNGHLRELRWPVDTGSGRRTQPQRQPRRPHRPALDSRAHLVGGPHHPHLLLRPRHRGVEQFSGQQPRLHRRHQHRHLGRPANPDSCGSSSRAWSRRPTAGRSRRSPALGACDRHPQTRPVDHRDAGVAVVQPSP